MGRDASLTLLASVAGQPGDAPIDMIVSHNSQYLYVLNRNTMDVAAFAIQADGSLIHLGNFGGLPAGSAGIAAW